MFFRTVGLRGRLDRIVLVSVTIASIARGISILTISILLVSTRSIAAIVCMSISTHVSFSIAYLRILVGITAFCIWKEDHRCLGHGAIGVEDPYRVRR